MNLYDLLWMTFAMWIAGAGVFLIFTGVVMMYQIIIEGGMP